MGFENFIREEKLFRKPSADFLRGPISCTRCGEEDGEAGWGEGGPALCVLMEWGDQGKEMSVVCRHPQCLPNMN